MKATSAELPRGPGWAFEIKWDGIRAIAVAEGGQVTLWSSNGIDMTVRFPELAGLGEALGTDAVLDGEIVALDEDDRPSFGLLQQRMHVNDAREAQRWSAEVPVVLQLFDVLWLDGHDLTALPYAERRRVLEDLVPVGPAWQVTASHVGDGQPLLDAARAAGLEGLVAKRLDSPYAPGKRSRSWLKVKVWRRQEFVVGGWTKGEGARADRLGALLVGHYEDGLLRYAGKVGTGFSAAELDRLDSILRADHTDRCPFDPPPPRLVDRQAQYVHPSLVVEVTFAEWTADGRLRHPAYVGQRDDKAPRDVVREP